MMQELAVWNSGWLDQFVRCLLIQLMNGDLIPWTLQGKWRRGRKTCNLGKEGGKSGDSGRQKMKGGG